jgi:enoyl-CoA hydratase/carnithine racemase
MTTIRFEQDHGVGTIVLANPPANRIGSQFAVDLRAAVHDASLSDSRVLVIRSDGPNFCMGGRAKQAAALARCIRIGSEASATRCTPPAPSSL